MSEIALNTDRVFIRNSHEQSLSDVACSEMTRKIISGDKNAFASYYNCYFETMYRQVQFLSGKDEATCLDIVQDAMLKAIRSMKIIESQSKLTAWSNTVAKSATYDWFRKQKQQTTSLDGSIVVASHDSTEEDENTARMLWIEQQLDELPAELKQILAWRYRLGWSLKKIGKKLGLKTGAVDGRIRRAIQQLRSKAK